VEQPSNILPRTKEPIKAKASAPVEPAFSGAVNKEDKTTATSSTKEAATPVAKQPP